MNPQRTSVGKTGSGFFTVVLAARVSERAWDLGCTWGHMGGEKTRDWEPVGLKISIQEGHGGAHST